MKKNIVTYLSAACLLYMLTQIGGGCAQIGAPTGGPRDSLAPVLVKATPQVNSINFSGNKITLVFNEYIDVQDIQSNLIFSPVQKNNPVISSNLKTINIRLKDSLLPNTTYHIQFGNAIKDINEGNILDGFSYTFSTGAYIDSMSLSGKVLLAETGKTDSTMLVMLYKDAPDSAVRTRKPDYATRMKGDGSFSFQYLPSATFNIYALKDGDGGKTYNAASELFAFADAAIKTGETNAPIMLYASAKEKKLPVSGSSVPKGVVDKKLRYSNNLSNNMQDILQDLHIIFNNSLKTFDSTFIRLTDTNFSALPYKQLTLDSTRKKITLAVNWKQEADYFILIDKDGFTDSAGNALPKSDTIRFKTKKQADYGSVVLRFKNINLSKFPVLQIIQGDEIKFTYPLTSNEWKNNMFPPGEYDIRILYDTNQNGIWDPGDFDSKRQPEICTEIGQKLSIRADWDNERDIEL